MQPLNSINVWNSAWTVLAAACFCSLLAGRKKNPKQTEKKTKHLESKDKCVPLVFIWTETAEKKVPEKQSRPALSPELSSPFKWLLIKRDAVPTVASLSRGFTADLSPTRVTTGPPAGGQDDVLGRTVKLWGKGGVAAWAGGRGRNHRRETRLSQQSTSWETSRGWAEPRLFRQDWAKSDAKLEIR